MQRIIFSAASSFKNSVRTSLELTNVAPRLQSGPSHISGASLWSFRLSTLNPYRRYQVTSSLRKSTMEMSTLRKLSPDKDLALHGLVRR